MPLFIAAHPVPVIGAHRCAGRRARAAVLPPRGQAMEPAISPWRAARRRSAGWRSRSGFPRAFSIQRARGGADLRPAAAAGGGRRTARRRAPGVAPPPEKRRDRPGVRRLGVRSPARVSVPATSRTPSGERGAAAALGRAEFTTVAVSRSPPMSSRLRVPPFSRSDSGRAARGRGTARRRHWAIALAADRWLPPFSFGASAHRADVRRSPRRWRWPSPSRWRLVIVASAWTFLSPADVLGARPFPSAGFWRPWPLR